MVNIGPTYEAPEPTSKYTVKATLPFGLTLKAFVASEALITYELSEDIAACQV